LYRRQSNIHDRVVEQDHALGDAHRDERHQPTSGTERLPNHVLSVTGSGIGVNSASRDINRDSAENELQAPTTWERLRLFPLERRTTNSGVKRICW
jgi:hypothetical protein